MPRMVRRPGRGIHSATAVLGVALLLASPTAVQDRPADDIRDVIEGTWRLVEWHVGDRVLRPPEMEGMWMVHDGWVMATRHRQGQGDFESTAGYGSYSWDATGWTYGYERSEDRRGRSPEDAPLRVTEIPQRRFAITSEGDHLILEDDAQTLRWDYDIPGDTFTLMGRNRRVIRVYARITDLQ
ncbi:MAG: hypothetical protein CL947_03540 [Epsilonproteobacteria bacterium]|nr:hypothetical protein [Campylobacterota bacterium]